MPTISCRRCGASIPANAPQGICPVCLLGVGMETGPAAESTGSGMLNLPPIEQLQRAFPQFEILHLIGHGGMGAVYQAIQRPLDRQVAIKILAPGRAEQPTFAERFLREARTMARLSHPNIVGIFDFGQIDSLYYLVMEYVEGVNLRDAMAVQTIEPGQAYTIIGQICDALQFAHDQGIVHRDIKPENILLTRTGQVKIADFGLAKLMVSDRLDVSLTGTQQVLGTVNYMAPEQFEQPETVDHRADLYALGVVFYELLTGELPMGRFAPPSQKANVSSRLDDVVMRTLEKDPGRRYQQASEVKTAVSAASEMPTDRGRRPLDRQPLLAPAVPFRNKRLYGGFAKAYGVIRATESAVELEFEVRDCLDAMKFAGKKVVIPYQDLARVSLHPRVLLPSRMQLQATRMDAAWEVPLGRGGLFSLTISRRDVFAANQLTVVIQQMIAKTRSEYAKVPMPPVKRTTASPSLDDWLQSFFGDHPTARVWRSYMVRLVILTCILLGVGVVMGVSTYLDKHRLPAEPSVITRPAEPHSDSDRTAAPDSSDPSESAHDSSPDPTVEPPDDPDALPSGGQSQTP